MLSTVQTWFIHCSMDVENKMIVIIQPYQNVTKSFHTCMDVSDSKL